jgi:hypothetical protein
MKVLGKLLIVMPRYEDTPFLAHRSFKSVPSRFFRPMCVTLFVLRSL